MNCRSHQISETVIRLIVGTNIAPRSQRLVLINQRGRHILSLDMSAICVSMCSLSACCLWMLTDAIPVSTYTRTHTLSLSVSLLPCLSLFHLKGAATPRSGSIEIQISLNSVLIISKVAPTRKLIYPNLLQTKGAKFL